MKSSDVEQKERRALAGSTTGMTLHSQAITQIELEQQGRHAAVAKASVSGSKPAVHYPRMPEGSPWAGHVPESVEAPFDVDISYVEPCGTPVEIAASVLPMADAACLATAEGPPSAGAAAGEFVSVSASSPALPGLRRARRL
jgi:hypothetical protein